MYIYYSSAPAHLIGYLECDGLVGVAGQQQVLVVAVGRHVHTLLIGRHEAVAGLRAFSCLGVVDLEGQGPLSSGDIAGLGHLYTHHTYMQYQYKQTYVMFSTVSAIYLVPRPANLHHPLLDRLPLDHLHRGRIFSLHRCSPTKVGLMPLTLCMSEIIPFVRMYC